MRLESLESRIVPTSIAFQIPPDVANQGVQVGVYYGTNTYLDPATLQYASTTDSQTSVPLISLVQPESVTGTAYTSTQWASIPFPNTPATSGELFIFVGPVQQGIPITSGTIAAPKVLTSPDLFSQFEYSVAPNTNTYDVDISFVDSVEVPLTATSPSDTSITPIDLDQVGIAVAQSSIEAQFQAAFPSGPFAQCYEPTLGGSGGIVAPDDILSQEQSGPTLYATALQSDTSTLVSGTTYNYVITACSNNLIPGTNQAGQSLASAVQSATPTASTDSVFLTWSPYNDPNTAGYDIYRSVGTGPYHLIAQVGSKVSSFEDTGAPAGSQTISASTVINGKTVPTQSDYGFNPLSDYYTTSIEAFFNYYATHQFVFYSAADGGVEWVGNTVPYTPASGGPTYTVLQVTAEDVGSASAVHVGQVVRIYEPFFSTNTVGVGNNLPPMPRWMGDGLETPGEMVFGADGAFASGTLDPSIPANLQKPVSDLENPIDSAIQRGLATNFSIAPTNWASTAPSVPWSAYPTFDSEAAGQLAAGTYYYEVAQVNGFGEAPASQPVSISVPSGETKAVDLTLTAVNVGASISSVSGLSTTSVTFMVSGVDPSQWKTVTVSGVQGSPLNGTFEVSSATSSSVTITYPSAPGGSFVAGTGMVSQFPPGLTATAISYDVYRGTSLSNMQLVANIPATGNTIVWSDPGNQQPGTQVGSSVVGTALPQLFYPTTNPSITLAGSTSTSESTTTFTPLLGSVAELATGMFVSGPGVPANTSITVAGSTVTWPSSAMESASGNFTFMTPNFAGTSASGSTILALSGQNDATTTLLTPGMAADGPGIPAYTTILGIIDATHVLLSAPAGVDAASGTFTFSTSSNGYASFIHEISINGMGYGISFDDQGGFSSNVTYSNDPGTATINLFPQVGGAKVALATVGSTLPNAAVGVPYAEMIEAAGGPGGNTFSITSGSLPAGLTLDPVTGYLSGTPTTKGSENFTVQVGDSAGDTSSQSYTINVQNEDLVITTPSLPSGTTGKIYSATVTGGISFAALAENVAPFTTLVLGADQKPKLRNDMSITGPGIQPDTTFTINGTTITLSQPLLSTGVDLGSSYTFIASDSNISFSLGNGAPAGLTIDATTGKISGTPTAAGTYTFAVTETDSTNNETVSQAYTIVIGSALGVTVNQATLPTGAGSMYYSQTVIGGTYVSVSGGVGPYAYAVTNLQTEGVQLPAGAAFVINSSGVLALIQNGVPVTLPAATGDPFTDTTFEFDIQVTDSTGDTMTTASTVSLVDQFFGVTQQSPATTGNLPNELTLYKGQSYDFTIVANPQVGGFISSSGTGLPAGMTVDSPASSTVIDITGTPTQTGGFPVTIMAIDAKSMETVTLDYTLNVVNGLTLAQVSPLTSATVGSAYMVNLNASGGVGPLLYSAVGLPGWLTLSSGGVLGGTPTAADAGEDAFTIKVSDAGGGGSIERDYALFVKASQQPSLAIQSPPPNIDVEAGVPFTMLVSTSGGAGPLTFTLNGSAPNWLEFDTETGVLSGTPPSAQTVEGLSIEVSDGITSRTTTLFNITVHAAVGLNVSPLTAEAGKAFPSTNLASDIANGVAPFDFSAPSLPSWLKLTSAGELSGTVEGGYAGTTSYPVVVTDSVGGTVVQTLTITVTNPSATNVDPGVIVPLPAADVGAPYYQAIETIPVIGVAGVNGLPAGLTNTNGTVSGAPTKKGSSQVTVTTASGVYDGSPFTFTVNKAVTNTTQTLPNADVGSEYSQTIQTSGGTGPYTFSLSAGTSLPADGWLTLNPATGLLSGTPGAVDAGTVVSFVITVADAAGGMASRAYSFTVTGSTGPAPVVTPSTNYLPDNASSLTIAGSGFDPTPGPNIVNVTLSSTGGMIPTGYTCNVQDNDDLVVSFASSTTLPLGALSAVVTVNGQQSGTPPGTPTEVADVQTPAQQPPTITPAPTNDVLPSATALTINGTNFDATQSGNVVTLYFGNGQTVTYPAVQAATTGSLTLALNSSPSTPSPLPGGAINASVTVDGVPMAGNPVQVASVIPVVTASSGLILAGSSTLAINGSGFASEDLVIFNNGATGMASANSAGTQLTVTLHAPKVGPLSATVIDPVNQVMSTMTQVGTVFPVVTANTANMPATQETLVITGAGFDPNLANDVVDFNSGAGNVTGVNAQGTAMTVAFMTSPSVGPLHAVVLVGGYANFAQVATVTAVIAPTVTPPSPIPSIPANAMSLTIVGANFDASDQVVLTSANGQASGSATTTFVKSTQLNVTLNPSVAPLTVGSLFATVTGDNGMSSKVQIANVVSAPVISPTKSTITLGAPTFNPLSPAMTQIITLQARDASGNKITTGGANVVFTLAPGSVGGLTTIQGQSGVTSVTAIDNHNGTYTAYYTSAQVGVGIGTLGTAQITASINGMKVTAAPSTTATFSTDFAVNSNFNGAPWSTEVGGFGAPTGGSVTTSSSGLNIGLYGGSVASGTGTSETIAVTVPALPASGSMLIGLVSRYTGPFAYYFAGLRASRAGYQWVIMLGSLDKPTTLAGVAASGLRANQVVDVTFNSVGPKLQLFMSGHNQPLLSTTNGSHTSGTVGILGTANVTFVGPFTAAPIDPKGRSIRIRTVSAHRPAERPAPTGQVRHVISRSPRLLWQGRSPTSLS